MKARATGRRSGYPRFLSCSRLPYFTREPRQTQNEQRHRQTGQARVVEHKPERRGGQSDPEGDHVGTAELECRCGNSNCAERIQSEELDRS